VAALVPASRSQCCAVQDISSSRPSSEASMCFWRASSSPRSTLSMLRSSEERERAFVAQPGCGRDVDLCRPGMQRRLDRGGVVLAKGAEPPRVVPDVGALPGVVCLLKPIDAQHPEVLQPEDDADDCGRPAGCITVQLPPTSLARRATDARAKDAQ